MKKIFLFFFFFFSGFLHSYAGVERIPEGFYGNFDGNMLEVGTISLDNSVNELFIGLAYDMDPGLIVSIGDREYVCNNNYPGIIYIVGDPTLGLTVQSDGICTYSTGPVVTTGLLKIWNVDGSTASAYIQNTIDFPSADASNPLVTMAGNTVSGAISGAGDIMSSDLGFVAYFVIGLSIISLVITAVIGFFYLRRGN